MNIYNQIAFVMGILLLTSCGPSILQIYSPDKQNCFTIITEGKVRYIIDGEHQKLPEGNYLKLDISRTTELSDAVYICWHVPGKRGRLVMPNTEILENRMNPALYQFNNKLPEDNNGIPRPTSFTGNGCTSVGFSYKMPYPVGSATIEERTSWF
jgi:hypothetical protein